MKSKFLHGHRIDPKPITGETTVVELVETAFQAYNAARLREACMLLTKKMLDEDVTIGMSLTGALTPAGLGISAIIPLIEAGFVDWIVKLRRAIGIPHSLGEIGIDGKRAVEVAAMAVKDPTHGGNPIAFSEKQYQALLRRCVRGEL